MMIFEPLVAVGRRVARGLNPRNWHRPHFNFITIHYMYILGCAILGSIIIYPGGGLGYTNTLFFTAGASTQAGLNTVNTNEILLYQQVVLMLIACIANPIFINTMVVFMRLYWFEKRFERVVKEARSHRRSRTRTMSMSKSEARADSNLSRLEMGIKGREIKVLHDTTKPNGVTGSAAHTAADEQDFAEKQGLQQASRSVSPTPESSNRGSNNSDEGVLDDKDTAPEVVPETPAGFYMGLNPRLSRQITFADEASTTDREHGDQQSSVERPKPGSSGEQEKEDKHIRFVQQQQRNAKSEIGTLRIPGPRDFDRGQLPKELDDSDDELHRPQTRDTAAHHSSGPQRADFLMSDAKTVELNDDDHPAQRAITINEPDHPAHRALDGNDSQGDVTGFRHTLSKMKTGLSHKRTRSKTGLNLSNAKGSMAKTFSSMTTARTGDRMVDPMPYLSWQATIGRNSAFLGLSQEQREELGGIEYRALKTLAKVLIAYFVGFHLLGMVILLPWILYTQPWKAYVESCGSSAGWWGVFTPASAFNDLGFTLTPDSMLSFQTATLPLLLMSFLIIIGNTGFPCMLRFVIWLASNVVPKGTGLWEELRFLLDHPRRCFTLLFPSRATWWLFWILVLLNGIDLIFFIILDLNDDVVTSLTPGFRVLNGLFQAASTRTAGFASVNIADLHPAIQVSYLIMMYISVFPIAISVRRTNVYEEKSLGIWGGEEDAEGEGEQSYVGQHLRRQLSFDLWYVFLGFFIICIVEGARLGNHNEYAFTMFSVLFEIVSAYGTVGLSLGYPTVDASFSSQFHILSKLVIIAMMIRGRHRGLPYALDRAILLPSENLQKKDEALARNMTRRMSSVEGQDRPDRWQDSELDGSGLPRQHTADAAMTAGAGGERSPEDVRRPPRRRSASNMTNGSQASGRDGQGRPDRRRTGRRGSIGTMLASGLSAGPTIPRHEHE